MGPALALVVFWLFMRPPWKRPLTILPFSITVRTWPVPSLTFKFYTWDICVPSIVLTNLGITTTNCMVIKCLCSCSTQKDPRSHRNSRVGMGMILIVCFQFEVNLSKMQFISNQDYEFYSHQSTSVKPLSRMTFPLAVLEARYANFFFLIPSHLSSLASTSTSSGECKTHANPAAKTNSSPTGRLSVMRICQF